MGDKEQILIVATRNELGLGREIPTLSTIPHVTLFPWITIDQEQWPEFDNRMKAILDFTLARNSRGLERVTMGPDPTLPHNATRLDGVDIELRVDIANIAIDLNGGYDRTYAEWDTEAHVSDTPTEILAVGDVFPIRAMTAIARNFTDRKKAARAHYRWPRPSRWVH